ncbi:unnamed protein product [Phytophthora lilii]|uniref:Unnamed protein product n=1 Tax=Phytophthora lilii TaxID=2077276 RepID=A0A9W6YJN4_9STRA|nr:unnamed protein product [Phytophthora lilii]
MESANEESDDNSEAGTLQVVDGSKPAEREVVRQQPNPVDVQAERLRLIRVAQDEERRWADLKAYLRGDIESLSFKRAASASKLADRIVIDEEDLLQYVSKGRKMGDSDEAETRLRLVVPTTMIDEVMQSCHDSIEGATKGSLAPIIASRDYYWIGLYATVVRHVRACPDCSISKGKPQLRGYSPGNVLADRPFRIVSMDFVTPLPRTRRGNVSLLLFQCSFTSYVIAKAVSSTTAQDVADVFEECPIQARSRATLSYRPQANGQQERLVKSMIQTVKVYVEDPLQQDWDEIAEKMVHAINNSMDTTKKETPFYLVHGWDAQSALKAMTSSLRLGDGDRSDAAAWRREANRQYEVVLAMSKHYHATEKARRAKEHIEDLGRVEQLAVPFDERSEAVESGEASDSTEKASHRSLFQPGSRVWLFMERVKPGLTKTLAHRWHGPFRIKRKVEEFAYELELPDKAGYRFYPVVHVSRLKAASEDDRRPTTEIVDGLSEDERCDFDEELLPEDSWEPEAGDDKYIVEAILDDRWPISTGTERQQRQFYVKWRSYDKPTWDQSQSCHAEESFSTISSSASARTVCRWFRRLDDASGAVNDAAAALESLGGPGSPSASVLTSAYGSAACVAGEVDSAESGEGGDTVRSTVTCNIDKEMPITQRVSR